MSARRPACYFPRREILSLGLLFPLVTALGCGDGKIKTYPVTGTVTVGGKPYPGARVLLVPIEGEGSEKFMKERPAGMTDAAGKFELTTFAKSDGAPAGEYTVMVLQVRPSSREQADEWGKRPPIDRKYQSPKTSGLKATVLSEPTSLAFDL